MDPSDAVVVYFDGVAITLTPIVLGYPIRTRGYHMLCPSCGQGMFLNTGLGERPELTATVTEEGKLSMVPGIECPFPSCGWKGRLTNGIIYHERRRR